ncbi:hypothetical protein BKA61DRAFT_727005 [Leptodontidium sp. MPI-SDFR-AT-0119]|nr:hypothetical protein BKA61DRAFT_727005 [Leptodontidium sp. MPI-SDFR-AT-0119]
MAYTPNRISAWMDDQSGEDNYPADQALIQNDNSRLSSQQLAQQEIDNMTVTDSEDYWEFGQVLEAFEKKRICPLIVGPFQLQEAREHDTKLGKQRQAMRPIKTTHMLDSRRIDAYEQGALLNIKTLFHVARTNFLSTSVIRSIIPSNIAINTWEYAHQCDTIKMIQEDCYESAFRFVEWAVTKIEEEVNVVCGPRYFAGLDRKDRYKLFGAVFRQYPAWVMSHYRESESKYVNFREIFGGAIRRRDLALKKKWRAFYEYGFVLFCDKVFLWQQGGGGDILEGVVKEAWLWMDRRERVQVLGVGGAFDLPAVGGTAFEKKR